MKNKIYKAYILILIILLSLTLVSCNNNDITESTENKITPIFQGMVLETQEENLKLAKLNDTEIKNLIDQDFGILTTDKISYYSYINAEEYITLKFHNPSDMEILSFVLNGTKYQSFNFTENSTSENISVKIKMPSVAGLHIINVEQIKYIDKEEIKDVRINAETSIKVGIRYDNLPNVMIKSNAMYETASFNINILDVSNVINLSKGKIKYYILNELGIVSKGELQQGTNTPEIKNLDINKEYDILVAASFDAFDSNGMTTHILKQETFKTKSYINLINQNITENSISFDIEDSLNGVNIKKVELYLNNNLVNTVTSNKVLFSNLLSNNNYQVKVYITYNGNNFELEYHFRTLKIAEPVVDINVSSTTSAISYEVIFNDEYHVLNIDEVDLLKNDIVIKTNNFQDGTFDNLLTNTSYQVKLSYSYDLFDGNGVIKEEIIKDIKTTSLKEPIVTVKGNVINNRFNGTYTVYDPSNLCNVETIILYKGNDVVDQSTTLENTFSFELQNNIKYTVKVYYSYDLNDGRGVIEKYSSYTFTSEKQEPDLECNFTNLTNSDVDYQISILDDNVTGRIDKIELFENGFYIKPLSSVLGHLDNLKPNTNYKIVVNFVYDYNDGTGSHNLIKTFEFITYKENPVVTITLSADIFNINYQVSIYNNETDCSITKVELSLDEKVVKESINQIGKFDGLLADNNYYVTAYYKYTLDGEYYYTNYVTESIFTNAVQLPEPSFDSTSTATSITLVNNTQDLENRINYEKVEVTYLGSVLKRFTSPNLLKDFVIDNLNECKNYQIIIYYSYNKSDGREPIIEAYTLNVLTKPLADKITYYKVTDNTHPIEGEVVIVRIGFNNVITKSIGAIFTNKGSYIPEVINNNYVDIRVSLNENINNIFTLTVLGYEYEDNNNYGKLLFDEGFVIKIEIIQSAKITGVYPINNQYTSLSAQEYDASNNPGYLVIVDINKNYIVTKIDDVPCYKISDNKYFCPIIPPYEEAFISNIDYQVPDGTIIHQNLYYPFKNLIVPKLGNDLINPNPIPIRTANEFFNMGDKEYILMNDLDFNNIPIRRINFNGVLHGEGHKLKNIKLNKNIPFLFNTENGLINNLYFENLNIDITGYETSLYNFLDMNEKLSAEFIFFSGNIISSKNVYVSLPNNNNYIVGSLVHNRKKIDILPNIKEEDYNNDIYRDEILNWNFYNPVYKSNGDYQYVIYKDAYIYLTKYIGSSTTVTVPKTIGKYPVIGIGEYCFAGNKNLQHLEIPNNVMSIEALIVHNCPNLISLSLDNLSALPFHWIMESLFGYEKYEGCYMVTDIGKIYSLPGKLESLSFTDSFLPLHYAVYIPNKIRDLELGGNIGSFLVQSLGNLNLRNFSIKNLNYPESIITFDSDVSRTENLDIDNYDYLGMCFSKYNSYQNLIINNLFFNGRKVNTIKAPSNVTSLNEYSLFSLPSITKVEVGSNIRTIGPNTFSRMPLLSSVTFSEGVTSIADNAFTGTKVKSITVPKSINYIGSNNLTDIYFNGSYEEFKNVNINYVDTKPNIHYLQ